MSRTPPSTFGPYVVHEELGTGGMATVHRAELPGIEGFSKAVALKRMLPSLAVNAEVVQAFVREANLASYLHHANVALTYELGNHDGVYFIAMELLTGRSLGDLVARCAELGAAIPVEIALSIINQILDALDYAHNLCDHSGQPFGIIHRDVSPTNVMVTDEGVVKLIDFGIAKASAVGMQTQSFTLKGKFAYMAPEYVSLGQIDARADIFAAGVIAHELLASRPLFSASEDLETLSRLRSMEIPTPSQCNPRVPPEIDHVVMAALARDPAERWQQASAMRNALAVTTRRLGLDVSGAQIAPWVDSLYNPRPIAAPAPVPAPAPEAEPPRVSSLPAPVRDSAAAIGFDTGVVEALRGRRSQPRGRTGAEPLWDMTPAPAAVSPVLREAVAVTVHDQKRQQRSFRRAIVISAVAIGIVAVAVTGYVLFA